MGELDSPARRLPGGTHGPGNLAGTGGTDGFGGFGRSFLKDSVGRGDANRPEDVATAAAFLRENGFLSSPPNDELEEFHRGIETVQARLNELSDGGLQVDGVARPWGPTEVLSQHAVSSGRLNPPAPSADPPVAGTSEPADSGSRKPDGDPTSKGRLQMEPEVASNNRRAAVERAAKKEAEFKTASDATNRAWEKVKEEGVKAGIQVGSSILSKRGRPGSAGLHASMAAYEQAKEAASRLREELHLLRADVADWDAEIRGILSRMQNIGPTSQADSTNSMALLTGGGNRYPGHRG